MRGLPQPPGFAAFSTGPTAGMHDNQPISGQQRFTLRSGIVCLKNGDTLRQQRVEWQSRAHFFRLLQPANEESEMR